MNKLIKSLLLIGLFVSISASDAFSQSVFNNTDCDFRVVVGYSSPGCVDAGFQPLNVPANGSAPMTVPFGARPTASKGAPTQFSTSPVGCPYYIGVPICTGLDLSADIVCSGLPCSSYTATLNPFTGNITINP